MDLSFNNIDDETAELVSSIIKDGIKVIQLDNCDLTKQGFTAIMGKLTKLINPVNVFITLIKLRNCLGANTFYLSLLSCAILFELLTLF